MQTHDQTQPHLLHDALGRRPESRDRPVVPPLLQVPVLVKLTTCYGM